MELMSLEFELPFVSFIFIVMLSIVYFSKKKLELIENKMYEGILIASLFSSLVDTVIHFISAFSTINDLNNKYYVVIDFLNKFVSTMFIVVFVFFLIYTLLISYKKLVKHYKKIVILATIFCFTFFLITLFIHVTIIEIGSVRNTTGPMITLCYAVVAVLLSINVLLTAINFKKDKRYYAVFFILVMLGFFYVLSITFKGLIIYDLILALLCYIMYFTIENPDLKMLKQMELAKIQAEKANHAKSDFLSSMSHEIRTPLNAIVGLSEDNLNYKDKIPEEVLENSEDIINASHTLLEIVGNILDINKIEANKMEIVNDVYNFKDEITKMCKVTQTRIGEKNVKFNLNIAPDIPYELIGDKSKVKEIVNNLLTNAIKYTNKGEINLSVKCINKDNISNLIITVQDTGIGIKPELISRLFTKFDRLDVEKNTTTEGTGLGLAITKSLVEMMGGKINVQSQYGYGSIFMVTIPQTISKLENPLTDTQIIKLEEIRKEEINNKNYGKKKVLIVDDNKLNIKVAKKALSDFDFEIDECYDGLECLDKVKLGNEYDLILMDIMMPNMSGETAMIKLKENPNFKIPTIALTADAVAGAEEKYKSEGFVDYIAKPFNKEQIKEKLDKIFD